MLWIHVFDWLEGIITMIAFSLFVLMKARHWELESERFSHFIRGFTTTMGIAMAIIVFLLASLFGEKFGVKVFRPRFIVYLLGIFVSLCLVFIAYIYMVRNKIQIAFYVTTFAFLVILAILLNVLAYLLYASSLRLP